MEWKYRNRRGDGSKRIRVRGIGDQATKNIYNPEIKAVNREDGDQETR